ncbi:O-linked N-acetylglucosamine transferase [Acetobacter aceti NRIC 0242]|uniref:O-linked N-acetylglucosamine transferase/flagellin modification protein FlbA n=1 Tax=Acetobacter aceti NBRC 14818 TaxID=887700 RepID=A0AB33IPQ1_ACEAC|nr:tetratricopeptide repeat protein [Acetobacter aceti]TCS31818.1 Flp pilus assembly protein TadD [Acetobacter aceti NBRC 14818]BCK77239.1 hypothetical protein EMQ_2845 [Acetobacter aceti NBRC 14818]GAN58283.1 O-linked N-acetylglucosamine transferase [Acetobacter aceti NBRC 14818]GBO80707.1 O-linked N-acetylglucosamine transferase [Acetobacter aceti NRIC 0242]
MKDHAPTSFDMAEEASYDELKARLAEKPGDPLLLHGIAKAAFVQGRFDQAVGYAGLAVRTDPRAEFHVTLGLALLRLGHVEAALGALRVAVLTDPSNPSAQLALSEVCEAAGQLVEAEAALRMALDLRPLEAGYPLVLSQFLARHGYATEALTMARRATRLAADDDVTTRQHEATLLNATGDHAAAEKRFAEICALRPTDPAAWANHGAMLFELGRLDEACTALEEATVLGLPTAETLTNLGLVHMALGYLDEAEKDFSKAIALRPGDLRVILNQATLLNDLGRREEAADLFRQVMQNAPGTVDAVRARFNLATVELAEGQFPEGWHDFEARRLLLQPLPRSDLPDWDGSPSEEPVLLCGEQGLGDYIQFLRFVPMAAERAPIRLLVPDSLATLVEQSVVLPIWKQIHESGRLKLITSASDKIVVAKASLLSLLSLLGVGRPSEAVPYLRATPSLVLQNTQLPRIGLCWSGNPGYRFDGRRSIAPNQLEPLLEIDGIQWVSLNRGQAPSGFEPLPEDGDMAATAARISTLDLVISVDTAIAHLAGAMGAPLWLLNRFGGDWRWAEGNWDQQTGRHLWYPQARLFAQETADRPEIAWREPVARAAEALRSFIASRA